MEFERVDYLLKFLKRTKDISKEVIGTQYNATQYVMFMFIHYNYTIQ